MTVHVWSYAESVSLAGELSAAAASVSGQSQVVQLDSVPEGLCGEGTVLLLKGPGTLRGSPEVAAEAIYRAVKVRGPSVILFSATRNGREVASRLAAKMRTGCLSDLSSLSIADERLVGERKVYAGKFNAAMSCALPCVATVAVGSYDASRDSLSTVEELQVGEVQPRSKVLSNLPKTKGRADLRRAKVVVSAGRGFKKKEDLAMVELLASAVGGEVGCSRPLSSDLGWLPEECHIGLTGVTVKPDLYLALGISGQLQHVAGIKDSKVIAAVNSDKDAPIFQVSDYGVVGDVYQLVPALIKALGR